MEVSDIFSELPVLATARLHLRRLTEADLDHLFAYTSDLEVARHIRRPLHRSRADAQDYLTSFLDAYHQGGVAPWGIEHKRDGKIIGPVALCIGVLSMPARKCIMPKLARIGGRLYAGSGARRPCVRV
jgi:hypothetical protein